MRWKHQFRIYHGGLEAHNTLVDKFLSQITRDDSHTCVPLGNQMHGGLSCSLKIIIIHTIIGPEGGAVGKDDRELNQGTDMGHILGIGAYVYDTAGPGGFQYVQRQPLRQ